MKLLYFFVFTSFALVGCGPSETPESEVGEGTAGVVASDRPLAGMD